MGVENAIVLPLARALLTDADCADLRTAMRRRRTAPLTRGTP